MGKYFPGLAGAILLLLSTTGVAQGAPPVVPDVSQPGGAQAGQEYPLPQTPAMPSDKLVLPAPSRAPAAVDGTRIVVRRIELTGVVERPEYDIDPQALAALVERLRQEKSEKRAQGPDPSRRQELLAEIERLAADSNADPAEIQALEQAIQRFREQRPLVESLSLHQLQEIAARVAQYYRERGLFLAQALVPPQTVTDGTVKILVMEGRLGQVLVEKNRDYPAHQLQQPFRELVGRPVSRQEIEAAMLLINDLPGLSAFAVFRPGVETGNTDLLISVLEEKTVDARVHGDNFGSAFTGEYRGRLQLQWNNPFGSADRLTVNLSRAFRPNNGSYGEIAYERRAFGVRNTFGFSVSQNAYQLGANLAPFGISGTTRIAQTFWRRAFHRGRLFNSYGLLRMSRKSARLDVTEGRDRADELTVASIGTGFDWSSAGHRHMGSGSLTFSRGFEGLLGSMKATTDPARTDASRRGGSRTYAGSQFSKWNLDYRQWLVLDPAQRLLFSVRAQRSGDLLTSLEQMPIGGPNSVRAYATSEWLRDSAVSASFEWIVNAPGFADWGAFGGRRWGELLKAVAFVDYAKGWLNDPLSSDREVVSLAGIGAGLRFHYRQTSARFEIATPLGNEPVSNGRDPQYYVEFSHGF